MADIFDDIIDILDANRKPNETWCNASSHQLFIGELPVGRASGMENTGAGVGDMNGKRSKFEAVNKADSVFTAAFDGEGDDTAATPWEDIFVLGHGMDHFPERDS